jgi:hypothetical protein
MACRPKLRAPRALSEGWLLGLDSNQHPSGQQASESRDQNRSDEALWYAIRSQVIRSDRTIRF